MTATVTPFPPVTGKSTAALNGPADGTRQRTTCRRVLADLRTGDSAWQLPADSSIAAVARARIADELEALGLPDDIVEAAVLMVSELATNAYQHAVSGSAELWLCPRLTGTGNAELVIAVFDRRPDRLPKLEDHGALAEHGRGLTLIDQMSGGRWGYHRTCSRLGETPVEGKAIWFAVPVLSDVPHLELLARELAFYKDVLTTRVVRPLGRSAYLRVAAVGDKPERNEQIIYDDSRAEFRWTWGEPIHGCELADKASTVARALTGRL